MKKLKFNLLLPSLILVLSCFLFFGCGFALLPPLPLENKPEENGYSCVWKDLKGFVRQGEFENINECKNQYKVENQTRPTKCHCNKL